MEKQPSRDMLFVSLLWQFRTESTNDINRNATQFSNKCSERSLPPLPQNPCPTQLSPSPSSTTPDQTPGHSLALMTPFTCVMGTIGSCLTSLSGPGPFHSSVQPTKHSPKSRTSSLNSRVKGNGLRKSTKWSGEARQTLTRWEILIWGQNCWRWQRGKSGLI